MDTEPEREILDSEVEVRDNRNEIEGQESDELEKLRLQIRLAEIDSKNKEMDIRKSEKEMDIRKSEKEMEMQVRLAEIELERDRLRSDSRTSNNSELGGNLDSLARKIRWALPKMPDKEAEVPSWFRAVEVVLQTYDVPEELQGQLVLTVLSEKCKTALNRLTADEIRDYQTLKQFLLDELRLSAAEYLKEFTSAEKGSKETWPQFAARMEDLYRYYLNSRGVDSFGQLTKLVVSDHLKTKLDADTKRYVLLQEGKGWLPPEEIARYADKHEEAVGKGDFRRRFERGKGIPYHDRYAEAKTANKTADATATNKESEAREAKIKCFTCGLMGHFSKNCPRRRNKEERIKPRATRVVNVDESTKSTGQLVARVNIDEDAIRGNQPASANKNIVLSCQDRQFSAIVDTGAEITVIRKALIPDYMSRAAGKIRLIGAFGQQVTAALVTIPISLKRQPDRREVDHTPVLITCALTDELSGTTDALISAADYCSLEEAKRAETSEQLRSVVNEVTVADDPGPVTDREDSGESPDVNDESKRSLHEAQVRDETLKGSWDLARKGKNGYVIEGGLLYHMDQWYGRRMKQVVLPLGRRERVLKLAHQSPWGGHLGSRKTANRIREAFFWPNMTADVKRYCQACHRCQVRAPYRKDDRTPISPLTRPSRAFQVVNLDVIGPIDPPSARGHKYALCLIDLCTRWPEVECIRSLSAKTTCNVLLQVFSRTGFPDLVCSDQGTNFTAQLTREMLRRMGVSIRFSTPEHPQSNGAVERWNKTFKNMLAHVIAENNRDWDRIVPFLLWAYREVPNETTGISPFELLYGRAPTGPLSVLRNIWAGEASPPDSLNANIREYLDKLTERIKVVHNYADKTAALQQQTYASHYNLRTRRKEFAVGDSVLVLKALCNRKTDDRWEGPGVIEEKVRNGSYRVKMENGATKWVHVDKLKRYVRGIRSVGVIFEGDDSFGEVITAPTTSRVIEPQSEGREASLDSCTQLTRREKIELENVLEDYRGLFDAKPGKTAAGCHSITLKEGWQPRRLMPYRIPLALKSKVDEIIDELLEAGLIKSSSSEFAHPIVCVAKKEGGIRLCVDYRYLNAGTVADRYPMAHPTELIYQIAQSRYITSLDLSRGYWQVPLDPSCRHMTAFVTHRGQFSWEVMPFGLKNASATFQRIMDKVLAPHKAYAMSYIDDIAIFSNGWREHLEHLRSVLESLQDNGFTVNVAKCQFAQPHIKYLGHIVGSGHHNPDPDRVKAITELEAPKTKKQMRSFLGICGYYRDYIEGFANVTAPLTNLLNRRSPNVIYWDPVATRAFCAIKERLGKVPFLHAPDPESPYVLFTDASEHAVGACLAQMSPENKERPVAFASRKLRGSELRWATIEKEAFAVVWALKKFHYWVYGNAVKVITDHNPLRYLTLSTPHSAKLARWALALQNYNVEIEHRKGKNHTNADALSRLEIRSNPEPPDRTDKAVMSVLSPSDRCNQYLPGDSECNVTGQFAEDVIDCVKYLFL
ncbi:uncharacterized protein [Centruroides vittatus]|uniref:uncharacterized protein n=1 Tax=Centruroides vittatus TaxID=120091 RepID=UPI00351092B7